MDIVCIPDTQVKPGVNLTHLSALSNYIVDHKPDIIVHMGDHWDFPSLNAHEDRKSTYFSNVDFNSDLEAGQAAMEVLEEEIRGYNIEQAINKKAKYSPRKIFLTGNHEYRIDKLVKNNPYLEGTISRNLLGLEDRGWEVYDFLEIAEVEGILFSHYFQNPASLVGSAIGGTIENKLKNIGQSFVMGHQQIFQYGMLFGAYGFKKQGIVHGSFYMHEEEYQGKQACNHTWHGISHLQNVEHGEFDPFFLSLESLIREYL